MTSRQSSETNRGQSESCGHRNKKKWSATHRVRHCRLTTKLSDRRRKRPVGCNNRGQITRTVRLSSGAAVRCSALVRHIVFEQVFQDVE
jgi:hypothetical protein